MKSKVPYWLVVVIGFLYRFIIGAFGHSLPRPHSTNFCPIFWVTVVGMTIGLPFILIIWLFRLIFGRGRAQWLGRFLGAVAETRVFITIGHVFQLLFLVGAVAFLGLALYALYKDAGWIGLIIFFGSILGIIGLIFVGAVFSNWRDNRKRAKRQKIDHMPIEEVPIEEKQTNVVVRGFIRFLIFLRWIPKIFFWLPKMIFKIIIDVVCLFGLMIHAWYKEYCPLVEFP